MTVAVPGTKNPPSGPVQSMPSGGGSDAMVSLSSTGGSGGQSAYIPLLENRRMSIVVPPGGFAGFAQQTAATQAMFQRAGRKGGKRSAAKRRKTRAPKKRAARAKVAKRTRGSKRKARLVKGSAAAKRYMASIRRKRRK